MQWSKFILLLVLFSLFLSECTQVQYRQGERLYKQYCEDCHMADGSGVAELYPSVNDMKDLKSYGNFPCIIRNGYNSETNVVQMLGIPKLTDVEINNIINYVLNDLNSLEYDTKIMEVQKLLDNCK